MKRVSCDVLVAGSGAAGLACAFAARDMGLDVILTEKAAQIGGTTAWSGGELWVPGSAWQRGAGIPDTIEAATRFLEISSKGRADPARLQAYVATAAEALDYFVARGAMEVEVMADAPDYFGTVPGAHKGGRTLRTVPFDGRKLGADFRKLRDPLLAGQIFGGFSVAREDIGHFQAMGRSPRSFLRVARLLLGHGVQRLSGLHRGARTTMGNAMAARFYAGLRQQGVPIWLSSPLVGLVVEKGAVRGARVETPEGTVEVTAVRGVVLATGGFAHDPAMLRQHYPHVARGQEHVPLPPSDTTGDGISIARRIGGHMRGKASEPAAWTAVSVRRNSAGVTWRVPHFGDRAKPGMIAVLPDGRRFANEAANYHDFCRALIDASERARDASAYLIADHHALRRYGLGRVGPFPAPLGSHLQCGYLTRGRTIRDLAAAIGMDPDALAGTVERFNAMALVGKDADFHKGEDPFDRASGDPAHRPNPCLAPLARAPFYAIRIVPGNLSTFLGLDTDARGAVLDAGGQPIRGLFALGADAESVAGGSYPAAGITLGPAVTFAYLTARALAA